MRTWNNFPASERVRRRALELVRRQKQGELTADEADELDHYVAMQALVRAARARQRRKVSG